MMALGNMGHLVLALEIAFVASTNSFSTILRHNNPHVNNKMVIIPNSNSLEGTENSSKVKCESNTHFLFADWRIGQGRGPD
jgi:hypothetical protein